MPRDVGVLDRLRKAGLKVVEVDGWRTRGSSTFNPRGGVDHHTAGSSKGNAPSLGICINGRADLPGPLCQILIARDLTCYLIAAGRANHAGTGGWKGLSGNSSVWGIERENVGTAAEPWRPEQTAHAAKVWAAVLGGQSAVYVCRHAEWAPARKVDTHSISGLELRALIVKAQRPKPIPPPPPLPEDDDMRLIVKGDKPEWYITDGITKRHVDDRGEAGLLVIGGLAKWDSKANGGKGGAIAFPQDQLDDIVEVKA